MFPNESSFGAAVGVVQVLNGSVTCPLLGPVRAYALLSVAMADARIATLDTKYHYSTWRPVSAIHQGR